MENRLNALFTIATDHFQEQDIQDKIKIIFQKGWGIEGWFQNELIVAWNRAGYDASTKDKIKYDADIVVENTGIELKCWKQRYPNKRKLINAPNSHPNADAYLFLSEKVDSMLIDLNEELSMDYKILTKQIGINTLLIMIFKKRLTA